MALTVLGLGDAGGAYLLRMVVARNLRVRFGRFVRGKMIPVPQGIYVYVGSARGSDRKLGQRLARHATRGVGRPHSIRPAIVDAFGSGCLPRGEKRLRWHIDFLVERRAVDVTHAIAIRHSGQLEGALAELLMNDPNTQVFAPGLGASDARGHTHLLRVAEDMNWWHNLRNKIALFTSPKSPASCP